MNSAIISRNGLYRYRLERTWKGGHGAVTFIMLNPSTADANMDDPTIRRCCGFARTEWGFSRLIVVNLYAFRATKPRDLFTAADPYGPENDVHIINACHESTVIICGWGNHGHGYRGNILTKLRLKKFELHHLGLTKLGEPRHPLYLRADTQPTIWRG